jgi:hypothetical protein
MVKRTMHLVGVLAVLSFVVAGTVPAATQALDKRTYFAFNAPFRVSGVLLPAGEYAFVVVNPLTSAEVVRVYARDGSNHHVAAMTRMILRSSAAGLEPAIVYREATPGSPLAIDAWYPDGFKLGRQFVQ